MPRRARIEAYCPNCEGLAVEASVDALLDARGVVDFRPEFTWRDRPFMRP
jgi:hypothetical protein